MLKDFLKQIADALRAYANVTDKINARDFPIVVQWVFDNGRSEGYEDGYKSGYEQGDAWGFNEGRQYGELECEQTHEAMKTESFEKGKQAEYDSFWDACQLNGVKTQYSYAFAGIGWNADNFKPKYDIKPQSAYMMFRDFGNGSGKGVVDLVEACEQQGIEFDTSNCTTAGYMFTNASISRVGHISLIKMSALENTFLNCSYLETIEKLTFKAEGNQIWYTAFGGCTKLKNINAIEGIIGRDADLSSCPLSKTSIVNVVNALSDTQTGRTLTLKKSAVNETFGIDVDDESTYPQGTEFYTLRHSKDNWTFSYV